MSRCSVSSSHLLLCICSHETTRAEHQVADIQIPIWHIYILLFKASAYVSSEKLSKEIWDARQARQEAVPSIRLLVSSTCGQNASLRCYWAADGITQTIENVPCSFSPQHPAQRGPVSSQSKCLRNTQSMQEMGQFLNTDCIFETQFKPGYRSLLFGECYTAHFQDCQTLCFRIPLPSCTKQPVIQLKTGLLSPISADEAKACDSFMVLHVTTGILSAAWLASLI